MQWQTTSQTTHNHGGWNSKRQGKSLGKAQQKNCLPRISPSKSSPTRQLKGSQDTLGRANSRDTLPGIGKTHALQLRTKRSIVDLPHRTGHEDKHGEDHFKTGELVPQVRSNSLGVQHYRPGHEHKHAQDHFQKGFEMLPQSESANVDELNILAPHYGHGWEKKGTEDHMKTGAGVMIVPTEGEEVMPGGVRKVHIEPKLASDFVPFASTDEDFLHRSPPADFYQKRRVKRTAAVPGLPPIMDKRQSDFAFSNTQFSATDEMRRAHTQRKFRKRLAEKSRGKQHWIDRMSNTK